MSNRVLRSKRGRDEEPIGPVKRQKTIDECEIEQMNVNDLIKIIGSNKHVNRVASEVYSRKYGDKTVCLSMQKMPIDESKLSKVPKKFEPIYKVVVSFRDDAKENLKELPVDSANPTDAEQFIGIFGGLVTRLKIDYAGNDKTNDTRRWKSIERLIMEHCTDSLADLTLEYNGGDAFNKIRKPFLKLESLRFENCILTSKIAMNSSHFPNVRQLVIDVRGFGDHQHFLNGSTASPNLVEKAKKIGTFVFPSIKMHNLVNDYGGQKYSIFQFLQAINQNMPNLTQLELYDVNLSTPAGTNAVQFDNVKDFVIRLREFAPLSSIPLSFAKLDELKLLGFTSSKEVLLNFITGADRLSKLEFSLARSYGNIDEDLKEIADKLKNLKEVTITEYDGTFSIDALKKFISNCTGLEKLRIRFHYGIIPRPNEIAKEISNALPNWNVVKSKQRMKMYGFRTELIIAPIKAKKQAFF